MVSIKTTDIAPNFMTIAERIFQGEKVLIAHPENQNLVIITEQEYNGLKAMEQGKARIRARLQKNIEALQQNAANSDAPTMTMEEIDAEVQAYRREKRG